jgi:alkanesulfonate monooxygenase SsuD/methylene tetrahydromethanopterin reductase-like flavin-dependent oxidoreductase (luciferase family)
MGSRPMKVGLFVPHLEDPWSPRGPRWRDMLDLAKAAEAVGFDSFWTPDHLFYHFENVNLQGGWDVWSLLAAIAAATERMEIAPLVACAGYRNPALIAKMAESIDEISGGRFILGIGAGWHKPEYDAFGFPYDHRVSRFEEAIQIIRGLLKDGHVDFAGRFYQARDCELRPRGPRPNGPPILVGGGGERMLGLTARYADQWNLDRKNDLAEVIALQEKVDGICREVGRDPATLGRVIGIQVDLPGFSRTPFRPRQFLVHPWPLTGSPEELAASIRAYHTRGRVDHLIIWPDPVSVEAVEAFGPVLAALDATKD